MSLPPAFLEALRARLPVSEIVGKRLRLTRAGREFSACCPFHSEKSPSFTVNDDKGFFHCFGCGAHGDIIGFVMRHDGLTFPEAVETLAALAGLDLPAPDPEARQRHASRKSIHEALEAVTRWYEEQLYQPGGAAALAYLRRRGLDDAVIAAFRLGYAPIDGAALRVAMVRAGYDPATLIEAGVLKLPAERGREPFSFLRNRVVFPVGDRSGRTVAFGGRLISGDGPKYLNTGETALWHKGRTLYGLSRARVAAAGGRPVVVVEGYMDVIALVRAGWSGAVAPLGTALTAEQLEQIWALLPTRDQVPVLCFDGDAAGRRAAAAAVARALPVLGPDRSLSIAWLPEGADPDSLFAAGGRAALEAALADPMPLVDVVWRLVTEGRTVATPEARAGVVRALADQVAQIADHTVAGFYRAEFERRVSEAYPTPAPPPPEPPIAGDPARVVPYSWRHMTPEVVAALTAACAGVRTAGAGKPTLDALRRASFALGQWVGRGELAAGRAEHELVAAAQAAGAATATVERLIRSGLDAGAADPQGAAPVGDVTTAGGDGAATAAKRGRRGRDLPAPAAIWAKAGALEGPAARWLADRGAVAPPDWRGARLPPLRPDGRPSTGPERPCLVAPLYRDQTLVALHLLWLTEDGTADGAPTVVGPWRGATVRLDHQPYPRSLVLTTSLERALALAAGAGGDPVWAGLSLANLASSIVPASARRVILSRPGRVIADPARRGDIARARAAAAGHGRVVVIRAEGAPHG